MSVIVQRDGIRIITFQKCGHTSIVNMFQTPAGQDIVRGTTPAVLISGADMPVMYKGFDASEWPEPRLTLAFFREPVKRARSAYEHFIVRTAKAGLVGLATADHESFTKLGFNLKMTFTEFCEHLHHIDLNLDNHLKPQTTSFIAALNGANYIYKLEDLSVCWPRLVKELDLPCTTHVVRFNEAKYDTTQQDDSINQLYADDYDLWSHA